MKGTEKQIKLAEEIKDRMNRIFICTFAAFEEKGLTQHESYIQAKAWQAALNEHECSWDIINLFSGVTIVNDEEKKWRSYEWKVLATKYLAPEKKELTYTERKLLCR